MRRNPFSTKLCDKAFETRIHPAVYGTFQEIGFRPEGEPPREVLEVVDILLGSDVTSLS